MEYVVVKYPRERQRNVHVDGQQAGLINRLIRVESGLHRFSLAGPKDFQPEQVEMQIAGTSATQPAVVQFDVAELD
jgi:hypothetical protein